MDISKPWARVQFTVCWDSFDADEIWAQVPRERQRAPTTLAPKSATGGLTELPTVSAPTRRAPPTTGGVGKWARGVALPPPEEGANRRRQPDADNPNELWDDPLDANKPAADFSSFGSIPDDPKDEVGGAFNFDKMTEATLKFEEELRGGDLDDHEDDDGEEINAAPVDASRPLATTGTTIRSGSGDNVNVFEDFDDPEAEVLEEAPVVKALTENPDASSRLMQMIGVTPSQPPVNGTEVTVLDGLNLNPWASNGKADLQDPPTEAVAGLSSNPWGGVAAAPHAGTGFDLVARLEAVAQEQKVQETIQMRQAREQEINRRRQAEEEAQRRALAQKQAEEQARQQQMQGPSQVELILMERISQILENSWGRSDLISVLSTLHSDDSRVIPLLGSVDALRSLVARHPRRVALRHDPAFGSEMAVLLMTNLQFQQHQQVQDAENRARQEKIQQLEQQRRLQAIQKKQNSPSIDPKAPWYYSDPQGNVQGPFRGEEMRQWLEAGYFKGDLPISQQTTGQFIPLANIFPDLSIAFRASAREDDEIAARAAAESEQRAQEEEQRRMAEAQAAAAERERTEKEALLLRARQEAEAAAAAEAASVQMNNNSNGGELNNSSNQLKMMLGLVGQLSEKNGEDALGDDAASQSKKASKKPLKQPRAFSAAPADTPAAKPPVVAWGGATKGTPRKSMSEIQQEEARTAALLAMERQATGRSNSTGWANVAATSGSGWQSGALKQQTGPAVVAGPNIMATPRPVVIQARASTAPSSMPVAAPRRASGRAAGQQAGDDFGATMNPALESWCKEQMRKLNGSDDLTLVSFCMTLNDPAEIRQYLTAYLGSAPQISNFATEFINRKGGGKGKTEEWETTVKPKKTKKQAVKK